MIFRILPLVLLAACASPSVVRRPPLQRELAKQPVSFATSDGVRIAANWFPANTARGPRPVLILLHGGNRYKERWEETGFVRELAPENYHYLALDIRGRGESESGDAEALRHDPTKPRLDVEAALAWARAQPGVDATRIALVGSSYGANLTCAGCIGWGFRPKTVVCFSATAAAYRFLHRVDEDEKEKIPSGLYLACDEEPDRYEAPETAKRLAEDTAGSSKVVCYPVRLHALSIFEFVPESHDVVRAWLRDQLESTAE